MVEYRFSLATVPLQEAIKWVDIDVNQTIADVTKKVCEAYQLQDILWVQLIYKGRVLLDKERFASLKIDPQKDVITIAASILNKESLQEPIFPLVAVEQLLLNAGVKDTAEKTIETFGNILESIGSTIIVLIEIEDHIYWKMVQEHIDAFKRSSVQNLILPLAAISHLIIRSLQFLGAVHLGGHRAGERLEVALSEILGEIGLDIAAVAKNQMINSHRTEINEEDIKFAYVQWQNKMEKLPL
jgi:histone H3/H4